MSSPSPAIEVSGVHKSYQLGRTHLHVLRGVSFTVESKEFVAVVGASGSGKSTLLHLIGLLDSIDKGTIRLEGVDIASLPQRKRNRMRCRDVGFVFQFYHLLPVLNAYENVELPLLLLPLSGAQRRQQVMTALELVGLADRIHHRPGQLSGGQQQRVGIARAVVTDPVLIAADEPTGDLDARSAEEVLDLLGELRRLLHKTILLVTHDPRAAARADRLLHLEKGQLVEQHTKDEK